MSTLPPHALKSWDLRRAQLDDDPNYPEHDPGWVSELVHGLREEVHEIATRLSADQRAEVRQLLEQGAGTVVEALTLRSRVSEALRLRQRVAS